MRREVDIEAILAPIAGDNPAGEDIRYSQTYEEIKEARRADDPFDRGDWQREVKTSDWDKVISLALQSLTQKTKDLQIAVWLTEALIKTEGYSGLALGLHLLNGLLREYWEGIYPIIEEGDLDFRAAPIEFLNDKLWVCVKEVPLTDPGVTAGYSWMRWQESREVGYEADTVNRYGDVDENKRRTREEKIAEGKLPAESFDSAVGMSSRAWFESLGEQLAASLNEAKALDATLDEKFGSSNAPSLSALVNAIEECERIVTKVLKEKKGREPAAAPAQEAETQPSGGYLSRIFKRQREPAGPPETRVRQDAPSQIGGNEAEPDGLQAQSVPAGMRPMILPPLGTLSDAESVEKARWEEALEILETSGIKMALEQLLAASCSAPSARERNRYGLLMAKLCLKAERPELARPIVEELHALIEELHLERWESPMWIAEVLDALYQCLTAGEPSDEDISKARELFKRLCITDVTKAMDYRS